MDSGQWGLYIEANDGRTRIFKVVTEELLINAALGPWRTLALCAAEIQCLFEKEAVPRLRWHVAYAFRVPGEVGFGLVDNTRAFICGKGQEGDPVLRRMKLDRF